MFLNTRKMPVELLHYKALAVRQKLNRNESYKMYSLEKGFEGECLYDKIFDEVGHSNALVIRDVYLKIGGSVTQYDSIIITNNRVAVNEIKNFTGDFRYERNIWFKNNKPLTDDAFSQLRRATGKLMILRNDAGINFEVDGALIFPNDDFRLSSEDHNIWNETFMSNYLKSYLRQFHNEYAGEKANNIATLIHNAIVDNPYFSETADICKLRRGLYCGECKNFHLIRGRFQFTCNKCGSVESYETHLLRAMSDYKFLFHNQPMTTKSLLYLIDNQISVSPVYRTFQKHCDVNKKGNITEYTLKYYDLEAALQETGKNKRYKDKIKKYDKSRG